jgi:hypothetical protein
LAERSARLELQVRVHGGVTYAGHGCGDLPEGWWFGFDCAHAGDAPDLAEATPVHREIHAGWHDPSEHVWTLEEVAAETERMAEQIAAVPA